MAGFFGRGAGLIRGGVAALCLFVPASALALPAVGLFLEGEPETLGLGGAPFHDLRLEARRLKRPALLADAEEGFALLTLDTENTLGLRAGDWAGTRAYDRVVALQAFLPLGEILPGVRLGAFASIEQHDSRIDLVQGGQSIFNLEKERSFPLLGLTTQLPYGLQLAAGAEGAPVAARWLVEGRWVPWEPLSFWVRHRDEGFRETANIPRRDSATLHSPSLHLPLDFQRAETEVGASFIRPSLWAHGGYLPGPVQAFWFEVGGKPWDDLGLRVGVDRDGHRLVDRLAASGTGEIAAVDLRLERLRAFAAAAWEAGPRDELHLHYTLARLQGSTWADELGTNAMQAFLHVDTDLGLLLEGGAAIQVQQMGLGWKRETGWGLRFALGAQYLRAHTLPSAISLVSFVLDRALAEESVEKVTAHLLGLTGFIEVPVGSFRLAAGLGQIVPVALQQERGPGAPSPRPPSRPREGWFTRLVDTLESTSGGTRLVFQAGVDF